MNRLLRSNFSADVQMELHVNGVQYSVARSGPGYVVLADHAEIQGGPGMVKIVVDGREDCKSVIVDDYFPFDEFVRYQVIEE
ncbi:hypothetical protein AB1L42_18120 [Thalassoglobus sp. JC818]|uniref:hypothetical protein n=1 Tax=Thalassoglobus sp. JC818 TaxID=3232136 RepID=UPI003457E0FC